MRLITLIGLLLSFGFASSVSAFEMGKYQMRDDFGTEPLSGCELNYYYYIPCPTYSWIWALENLEEGDMVGTWFQVGDASMGGSAPCDPLDCYSLEQLSVLDYSGYGTTYASIAEFSVFCSDEDGCPAGPALWESGAVALAFGWNDIAIDPPLSICGCAVDPGPPPSAPRILVTGTNLDPFYGYPLWGLDNISTSVTMGCEMHDYGSLPASYPRPYTSYYPTMHSGYYGKNFEYCPPVWFKDPNDTTPDGTQYGFLELMWRVRITCGGPTSGEPATWSSIKSLYR